MINSLRSLSAAAALLAGLAGASSGSAALPVSVGIQVSSARELPVQTVQYRHRGGGGFAAGVGAGIVGGVIGGALLAPRYYGPTYYYERPYYPRTYYYSAPPPPPPEAYEDDDAVSYCMRRFRSYDPRSGTYLGYDGLRHPCP